MSYNTAGPYGSTAGTSEGPGTSGHTSSVITVECWNDGTYVYGIKLFWSGSNFMFGSSANGTKETFDLSEFYCKKAEYYVDGTGNFRGLRLTNSNSISQAYGAETSWTVAFNNANDHLTDLLTYKITLAGGAVIINGITFYYTGPARFFDEEDECCKCDRCVVL